MFGKGGVSDGSNGRMIVGTDKGFQLQWPYMIPLWMYRSPVKKTNTEYSTIYKITFFLLSLLL